MKKTLIILFLLTLCTTLCMSQDFDKAPNSKRAEWMSKGTYGMMTHYLISPQGNTEAEKTADFNKTIDNFDLNLYMKAFDASKADWLIFTIGQNTGYWNSPNSVIDSKVPGRTPNRDLVLEVAKAVKKRGKHFIAYLPGEAEALPEQKLKDAFNWNDGRMDFFFTWEKFLREYSLKLGKNCDGWWIDGCYPQIHQGKFDWSIWAKAMRAGNPNSIVAFSDASYCVGNLKNLTSENDYFPGEVHATEDGFIRIDPLFGDTYLDDNGKIRLYATPPKFFVPKGKYLDGALLHALVPLDSTFNPAVKNEWTYYPVEDMIRLAHSFDEVGGAITFNVPVEKTGEIPQSSVDKLIAIGNSFKDKTKKYPLDMTVLERSKRVYGKNPNPDNKAFGKPAKLLNLDGSKEAEPSGFSAFAWKGNDGDERTGAAATDYWAWTYWLDLEAVTPVKKITLKFSDKSWSTLFNVQVSVDGVTWISVASVDNVNNEKSFSWEFPESNIRYVIVQSSKPNDAGQLGGQMVVSELQVF